MKCNSLKQLLTQPSPDPVCFPHPGFKGCELGITAPSFTEICFKSFPAGTNSK